MKQKHKYFTLNRYTVGIFIFVIALATSTVFIARRNHTDAASSGQPPVGAAVPSEFKFTGATDWWQGATSKTDMALFHKIQDSCFTSIQHKTGDIAADKAKLQKTNADLISDGYTVTPGATLTVMLQTNTGQRSYQLEQSSITPPPGGEKVLGGQEFGYLPLSDKDYIFVEGFCETVEQLGATVPALQAIKFEAWD